MTILDAIAGNRIPNVLVRIKANLLRGINRAIDARLRRVERDIAMFRIHSAAETCIRRHRGAS